jgi:hypothetical protein
MRDIANAYCEVGIGDFLKKSAVYRSLKKRKKVVSLVADKMARDMVVIASIIVLQLGR